MYPLLLYTLRHDVILWPRSFNPLLNTICVIITHISPSSFYTPSHHHRNPYSLTQRRTVFQCSSHTSLKYPVPELHRPIVSTEKIDIDDPNDHVLSYCAKIYANSLWINIFNYFFCFDYCFLAIRFCSDYKIISFYFWLVCFFNVLNVYWARD